MSFTTSAFGVNIQEILSMFGSKNQNYFDQFADRLDEPDELAAWRRAVFEGVPFSGLHEEEEAHVYIMKFLFEAAPDQTWGDVTFRNSWLFDALDEPFLENFDPSSRNLFKYFAEGRPIFGHTFGAGNFYGYLDTQEVRQLSDALKPFRSPEPDSPQFFDFPTINFDAPNAEFLGPLVELLPMVIRKGQGLAMFTC